MVETALGATRSRGVLLLGVIFLLGMVCGAAVFYLGQRSVLGDVAPPARRPGDPMRHILRELELRPEQHEQIRGMIRERHEQISVWLEESRDEIRGVLDPDQQQKFDELHRRPPRRGRRGPGRGPFAPGHPPAEPPPPPPSDGD